MTTALNAYTALAIAIVFEVTASAFLQQSAQFTRPWATLAMVLCYVASFYALSIAIRGSSCRSQRVSWSRPFF